MTAKLSEDQRRALDKQPDRLLKVEDDRTHQIYIMVEEKEFARLLDDELKRHLQIGIDQVDRGEVAEWDPERIKAEGRRRLVRELPNG